MRIATWNLWWRFGPWENRAVAIETTLRTLDADVVCLQEVWVDQDTTAAHRLADRLGYHVAVADAPTFDGLGFTNAILARGPIVETSSLALPDATGVPGHRRALMASIGGNDPVDVVSTHLDHQFDRSVVRAEQLAAIVAWITDRRPHDDQRTPVVLGGDLNAVPDSDEIRRLTGRSAPYLDGFVMSDCWDLSGHTDPGWTWDGRNPYQSASTWPNRRIDYLLVGWPRPKGVFRPVSCEMFGVDPVDGVQPSDHHGVVADLHPGPAQ